MGIEKTDFNEEVREERPSVRTPEETECIAAFNVLTNEFSNLIQLYSDQLDQQLEEIKKEKDPWKAMKQKDRFIKLFLRNLQGLIPRLRRKAMPIGATSAARFGEIDVILFQMLKLLARLCTKSGGVTH